MVFDQETPHEIRLGEWQDTPHAIALCAVLRVNRESYLRDIATQLSYCNHKCYVDHCKVPVLALQYHAMAS